MLGVRKKLGVSSFLDFQGAWYALFEALNGSEQFGVARSSWTPPTRSGSEFCEAVRSCLEARFEAVRKFSFYIKNKIGGELLGSILAAARKQFGVAWKRVSKRFRNLVFI